ncbi:MAG: sulfate permease [Chloroflexi bacterium]|nr:sulfate permease [Chloroflexota bacterium]
MQIFGKPFIFSLSEFSGALADLGVMLPLVLGLISINGMDATAAFFGIGLAYIFTALVYRLPIPVQPLKSVSALALALGLAPAVIVTSAIWNAVVFLGLGILGLDKRVGKAFPKPVVRGIQLGLAYLLFRSAWGLVSKTPAGWESALPVAHFSIPWNLILTLGALVSLLILLAWKKDYASLGVFGFGIGAASLHFGPPDLILNITLPRLLPLVPTWDQLWQGLLLLALPQIPLSLGNSVYATADAARHYFKEQASHVTERRLMLTMGFNDMVSALIGGIPVCHGCGGLTAHYRLGARSGGAPLMLGSVFLILAIFGGNAMMNLFRLVPFPVLGILLAFVGWQHFRLALNLEPTAQNWTAALLVLALTIWTGNLAISFASSAILYHSWSWAVSLSRASR